MTKDEIIMLARKNEALSDPEGIEYFFSQEDLIALVGIAVRAEREACAMLCEDASGTGQIISCKSAAAAIRARSNHDQL